MASPSFPLVSMRWRDLLFANWPVDPGPVAERLPEGVTVDTVDGDAYLAIVAFEMADIRPRGLPVGRTFGELNLRTYVTVDGRPAVYFFSIDSDDRLGSFLAGRLLGFPYYSAEIAMEVDTDRCEDVDGRDDAARTADGSSRTDAADGACATSRDDAARGTGDSSRADAGAADRASDIGDGASTAGHEATRHRTETSGLALQRAARGRTVRFRSRRRAGEADARFDCRYRPAGSFSRPRVGSTEESLLERYRFYVTARGRTYYADIDHEPWTLAPADATFYANTVFEAAGFEPPDTEPLLHVGVPMSVISGRPRRLEQ